MYTWCIWCVVGCMWYLCVEYMCDVYVHDVYVGVVCYVCVFSMLCTCCMLYMCSLYVICVVLAHEHMCEHMQKPSGVFLHHSPSYCLEKGLLTEAEALCLAGDLRDTAQGKSELRHQGHF